MAFRGAIPDFQLANPLYIGARASFFTIDQDGARTTTLATLYADPTGTQTLANPQTFDSEGKFEAPVYIEEPVIAEVSGPNVESHTTGAINARGTWRGDWATGTVYFSTDFVQDPITGNVYAATNDYESSASVATDVANGDLTLVIDQADMVSGGASLAIKVPVRVATTANITLSGLQTIDGIALAAGDRVLVKNQTSNPENGIYNAAVGAWTRAVDADASNEFADGCVVNVRQGTLNAGKRYQLSMSTPFTLGTSAMVWVASEFPASEFVFQMTAPSDANLTTGIKGYSSPAPFDCTIDLMTLIADAAGSMVVDIYKAAFPSVPTSATPITASAKPTLTAAQATQDSTLTGWTLAIAKNDVLAVDIISVSGLKFATLTLRVNRN
jgi:hypothetical protein